MKKITLKNSFHGTEVEIFSESEIPSEAWLNMQLDQSAKGRKIERRIRKALCGMSNCKCGIVR
jgi:hypothetical protein